MGFAVGGSWSQQRSPFGVGVLNLDILRFGSSF